MAIKKKSDFISQITRDAIISLYWEYGYMGYWKGTNGISAAWRVGPSLFVLSAVMIWKDYRGSILMLTNLSPLRCSELI